MNVHRLFILEDLFLQRWRPRAPPRPKLPAYWPCFRWSVGATEDIPRDHWASQSCQDANKCRVRSSVLAEFQPKPWWFQGLSCSFNWVSYPLVLTRTLGGGVPARGTRSGCFEMKGARPSGLCKSSHPRGKNSVGIKGSGKEQVSLARLPGSPFLLPPSTDAPPPVGVCGGGTPLPGHCSVEESPCASGIVCASWTSGSSSAWVWETLSSIFHFKGKEKIGCTHAQVCHCKQRRGCYFNIPIIDKIWDAKISLLPQSMHVRWWRWKVYKDR